MRYELVFIHSYLLTFASRNKHSFHTFMKLCTTQITNTNTVCGEATRKAKNQERSVNDHGAEPSANDRGADHSVNDRGAARARTARARCCRNYLTAVHGRASSALQPPVLPPLSVPTLALPPSQTSHSPLSLSQRTPVL